MECKLGGLGAEGQMIDSPKKGTSMGFLYSALNSNLRLNPCFTSLLLSDLDLAVFGTLNLSCRKKLETVATETSHTEKFSFLSMKRLLPPISPDIHGSD